MGFEQQRNSQSENLNEGSPSSLSRYLKRFSLRNNDQLSRPGSRVDDNQSSVGSASSSRRSSDVSSQGRNLSGVERLSNLSPSTPPSQYLSPYWSPNNVKLENSPSSEKIDLYDNKALPPIPSTENAVSSPKSESNAIPATSFQRRMLEEFAKAMKLSEIEKQNLNANSNQKGEIAQKKRESIEKELEKNYGKLQWLKPRQKAFKQAVKELLKKYGNTKKYNEQFVKMTEIYKLSVEAMHKFESDMKADKDMLAILSHMDEEKQEKLCRGLHKCGPSMYIPLIIENNEIYNNLNNRELREKAMLADAIILNYQEDEIEMQNTLEKTQKVNQQLIQENEALRKDREELMGMLINNAKNADSRRQVAKDIANNLPDGESQMQDLSRLLESANDQYSNPEEKLNFAYDVMVDLGINRHQLELKAFKQNQEIEQLKKKLAEVNEDRERMARNDVKSVIGKLEEFKLANDLSSQEKKMAAKILIKVFDILDPAKEENKKDNLSIALKNVAKEKGNCHAHNGGYVKAMRSWIPKDMLSWSPDNQGGSISVRNLSLTWKAKLSEDEYIEGCAKKIIEQLHTNLNGKTRDEMTQFLRDLALPPVSASEAPLTHSYRDCYSNSSSQNSDKNGDGRTQPQNIPQTKKTSNSNPQLPYLL